MPQSLTKVYVYLVFSTKYREPIIGDDVKDELYAYLGGVCQALECHPVRVGGYYDHVHILCVLSKKTVVRYIENQYEHHHQQTFQDECRSIYKKYAMPFDERYVWD